MRVFSWLVLLGRSQASTAAASLTPVQAHLATIEQDLPGIASVIAGQRRHGDACPPVPHAYRGPAGRGLAPINVCSYRFVKT
jgi:hypothetical protein